MAEDSGCSLASNPSIMDFAVTCGFATVGEGKMAPSFDVIRHASSCRSCARKVAAFFRLREPTRFRQRDILKAAHKCLEEIVGDAIGPDTSYTP